MGLKLRYDSKAISDLKSIRDYIGVHGSPVSAERVRRHLEERIDRLPLNPYVGAKSTNPKIRILAPQKYPYRVYYSVRTDEIVILHIRHTSRAAPKHLK